MRKPAGLCACRWKCASSFRFEVYRYKPTATILKLYLLPVRHVKAAAFVLVAAVSDRRNLMSALGQRRYTKEEAQLDASTLNT